MLSSRLFWRVFFAYGTLSVGMAAVFSGLASHQFENAALNLARADVQCHCEDLAALLVAVDEPLERLPQRLPRPREDWKWALFTADGMAIGSTDAVTEEVAVALREGWASGQRQDDRALFLTHSVRLARPNGEIRGVLQATRSLGRLKSVMNAVRWTIWQTAVTLVGVALAVSYVVIARIVWPLDLLSDVSGKMADGDLRAAEDLKAIRRNNEIGELSASLQVMSQQLQIRIEDLENQKSTTERNRQELSTVLTAMVEGVIAVDSEERIVLANDAATRLLDVKSTTASARPLWESVRHVGMQEVVGEVLADGVRRQLEFVVPRTQCAVQMIVSSLPGKPRPGAVLVLHDVTELRKLENLRREFVANVSHELKTPLATISAYTETLLDGAAEDPTYCQPFLRRIGEQVDRLHTLIMDLLSIAQMESHDPTMEIEATQLGNVLQVCVEAHQAVADAKGVTLRYTPPPASLWVHADRDGLRTIFDNLLHNAISYSQAGGEVALLVRVLNEGSCEIDVMDTGIGIAPEHQVRIFERFYRVDKARSREVGGTGLGLSIVKHLCEVFGGTVSVNSRLGYGSTFTVKLPQVVPPQDELVVASVGMAGFPEVGS